MKLAVAKESNGMPPICPSEQVWMPNLERSNLSIAHLKLNLEGVSITH